MNPALSSHRTVNWPTPKKLFTELNNEFHFDFDPCPLNGKVGPLFGFDGLHESWKGRRVFVNPPYGPRIGDFMAKAVEADLAVFLVPARTDTRWFHQFALKASEIRFIRGRIKFEGATHNAPFPSMIVIFKK
jgi:hypothetical protein